MKSLVLIAGPTATGKTPLCCIIGKNVQYCDYLGRFKANVQGNENWYCRAIQRRP